MKNGLSFKMRDLVWIMLFDDHSQQLQYMLPLPHPPHQIDLRSHILPFCEEQLDGNNGVIVNPSPHLPEGRKEQLEEF